MAREGLTVLGLGALLLAGQGCSRQSEPSGSAAGTGGGSGSAGAEGTAGNAPFDSPYFLFEGGVTAVDDKYVFMQGNSVSKAEKRAGSVFEPIVECLQCYKGELAADGGYVYLLADDELWRVNREDGAKEVVALPWSHLLRGGLMVDETYAYTIMPGCAAISRIDKRTLAFDPTVDVMYIEAPFPEDAGLTRLARSGEKLVCGTPARLFVVDEWGQGALLADGFRELWGLVVVGEYVYWVAKPLESARSTLYRVPMAGGEPTVVAMHVSIDTPGKRILYSAARGQIVYGTNLGLRTYTIASGVLSDPFDVGVIADIALDDEFVYAGVATDVPDELENVHWVARVPLSDL